MNFWPNTDRPVDYNGHTLGYATRDVQKGDEDGRLYVHIVLYCYDCGEKGSFRVRLPKTQSYRWVATIGELYAYASLPENCEPQAL